MAEKQALQNVDGTTITSLAIATSRSISGFRVASNSIEQVRHNSEGKLTCYSEKDLRSVEDNHSCTVMAGLTLFNIFVHVHG